MQAAQVTIDNFIATPIAGVLFAVSLALPLWVGGAGYIIPIVLAIMLPLSAARPLRDRARRVPDADAPPDIEAGSPVAEPVATPLARLEGLRARGDLVPVARPLPPHDGGLHVDRRLGALVRAGARIILFFLDELGVAPAAIGFVTAGIGVGALLGSIVASGLVQPVRSRPRHARPRTSSPRSGCC